MVYFSCLHSVGKSHFGGTKLFCHVDSNIRSEVRDGAPLASSRSLHLFGVGDLIKWAPVGGVWERVGKMWCLTPSPRRPSLPWPGPKPELRHWRCLPCQYLVLRGHLVSACACGAWPLRSSAERGLDYGEGPGKVWEQWQQGREVSNTDVTSLGGLLGSSLILLFALRIWRRGPSDERMICFVYPRGKVMAR